MAETRKAQINNWDTGIVTSKYARSIEEFSSGFSMVKNYDIFTDPKKIIPVEEFTSFATEAERELNFQGLGSVTNRVFATGRAVNNWFGYNWNYRIKITPISFGVFQMMFDLSLMPDHFWDNVRDEGGDIRVTRNDGVSFLACDVLNMDVTTKTGWITMSNSTTDYFYVYYGNATANQPIAGINTSIDRDGAYQQNDFYAFIAGTYPIDRTEILTDNRSLNEGSDTAYGDTVNGSAIPGFVTRGITEGTYYNNDENPIYPSDDNLTLAFLLHVTSAPTAVASIGDNGNDFAVRLRSDMKLELIFNTDSDPQSTVTGTTVLDTDTTYRIVAVFDDNSYARVYLDGVLEIEDASTSGELDIAGNYYYWTIQEGTYYDIISMSSQTAPLTSIENDAILTLDPDSYWTVGSEEEQPNFTYADDGISLYYKDLDSSAWEEVVYSIPIKSFGHNPVVTPIFASSTQGIITFFSAREASTYVWGSQANSSAANPADFEASFDFGSIGTNNITFEEAIDGKQYFGHRNELISLSGDVFTGNVFSSYPIAQSVESYNGYLAIGGYRSATNQSWLQIWDRANTLSTQTVDFGQGKLRVVGNSKGVLFGVVNNFIDDEDLALNGPSMDIRVYTGGNTVKTTHKIELPTTMEGYYDELWEQPVSQLKGQTKNATVFYAKMPSDTEGNYFEGLWAVGVNELSGTLALSLMYDTSDMGDVFNLTTTANQIVMLHNTNACSYLNPTPNYSSTASFETLIFNDGNSEEDKEVVGVEITHESLTEGQVINVFKKADTDSDWVLVMTSDEAGKISKEVTRIESSKDQIGNFKEIQWKVESTGGESAVTGFAFRYEQLPTNV